MANARGELAKKILIALSMGIIIPAVIIAPNLSIALKPLLDDLSKKSGTRGNNLIRSLTSLKRKRLISVIQKDGKQIMTLSEKGQKKILEYNLESMAIAKPKNWDGFWRIIIFDIPEKQKEGREAIRSKLKTLGFYQLQKSCFVFPYECQREVDFITEIFEISPYVNFILAKNIEGEDLLKRSFGLQKNA